MRLLKNLLQARPRRGARRIDSEATSIVAEVIRSLWVFFISLLVSDLLYKPLQWQLTSKAVFLASQIGQLAQGGKLHPGSFALEQVDLRFGLAPRHFAEQ